MMHRLCVSLERVDLGAPSCGLRARVPQCARQCATRLRGKFVRAICHCVA